MRLIVGRYNVTVKAQGFSTAGTPTSMCRWDQASLFPTGPRKVRGK